MRLYYLPNGFTATGSIVASLALLGTPATSHAVVDDLVRQGVALTEKDQGRAAFDLLSPQEIARAGDPDFDLVLGVAANQAGEFNRAIFALERVVVSQSGNARARAELARALFAVGDTIGARRLLAETKEQGVPVEVARTLDQFMQAIDRVEEAGRSSLKGHLDAGIGHDSNVNGAPANNVVAVPSLGGLLVTLTPAGTKTSSSFSTLGGGLSGRHVLDPRWSLLGNVNAGWRWNGDAASQFNSVQLDANAGVSYRAERNEFSGVLQFGTYDVGGQRVRDASGFVGEWTHRFDGFRQFGTYLQSARLSYPGQTVRDVQRTVLGFSYAHLFRGGLMAFGGLYGGSENEFAAAAPHLGHKFTGLRGGLQNPFSDTLSVFATLGIESRAFGGPDPNFLVNRTDNQTNLSLGMTWVPAKAWRVTPQIASTQTKSNVAINEFDTQTVSVTVRREF